MNAPALLGIQTKAAVVIGGPQAVLLTALADGGVIRCAQDGSGARWAQRPQRMIAPEPLPPELVLATQKQGWLAVAVDQTKRDVVELIIRISEAGRRALLGLAEPVPVVRVQQATMSAGHAVSPVVGREKLFESFRLSYVLGDPTKRQFVTLRARDLEDAIRRLQASCSHMRPAPSDIRREDPEPAARAA